MPRYKVGEDTYNIPDDRVDDFLFEFPDAEIIEEEEEEITEPTSDDTPLDLTPTPNESIDIDDDIDIDITTPQTGTSVLPPQQIKKLDQERKIKVQTELNEKLEKSSEDIEEEFEDLNFETLTDQDRLLVQDIAEKYLINSIENDKGQTASYDISSEEIQSTAQYILGQAQKLRAEEVARIEQVNNLDIRTSFQNAWDNAVLEGITKTGEMWTGESEALDIASAALGNTIFGQEQVDSFVDKHKDKEWLTEGLGTKEILESLPKYLKQQERRKETLPIIQSFKQGEYLKGGAAILGTGLNMIGSVAYGAATLGTGYFFDFAAENYIEYNEGLAQRKGKTLEQLILDGEANTTAPVGIAMTQSLAEVIGLTKILKPLKGKKILPGPSKTKNPIKQKIYDSPFGTRSADIFGAGITEMTTEMYQGAATVYNEVLGDTGSSSKAKDAFIDHLFSQEGLEEGLQGLFGGSKIRGGRYILKAANSLRAPADNEGIQQDIKELGELNVQYLNTKNKAAKEGIQQKINEVKSRLDARIVKANRIIPKLTPVEIDEVNNMNDLAELQVTRVKELHKDFDEGKINRKEYITALDGYKATYLNAKNRIKGIADSVKVEPEEKIVEDTEVDVSEKNKIISDKNEEATKVLLNKKSTASQIDTAKEILTTNNQGIINSVINKYYKPNLDTELDKEEFTAAVGLEVQNLINSYGKNRDGTLKPSEKVAPFGAYLKENLPRRIPGIFDEQIETKDGEIIGKVDITQTKGLAEDIDIEADIQSTKEKERVFLAEKIKIPKQVTDEVIKAVEKTFVKAKIPKIGTPEFENFVKDSYRTELKPVIADLLGTREKYETFIRDNFEKIYEAIPQSIINKRFQDFKQPILDKEGKQKREPMGEAKERGAKTPGAGKPLFEKKKLNKAEFVKYFLGRDVGTSTKGTRKTALAEALGEVLANEISLDVLQDKNIQEKFKEIESLKDPAAVQKIDDLINYIDKTWGRKSGKLFAGPMGIIIESITTALKAIKAGIKAGAKIKTIIAKEFKKLTSSLKPIIGENNTETVTDILSEEINEQTISKLTIKDIEKIITTIDKNYDLSPERSANFLKIVSKTKDPKIKKILKDKSYKLRKVVKGEKILNKDLADKTAQQSKKIIEQLPIELHDKIPGGKENKVFKSLFGVHLRYLDDAATKKATGKPGPYHETFKRSNLKLKSLENLKNVLSKEAFEALSAVNFDKIQFQNLDIGSISSDLIKQATKIAEKNISRKEKINEFNKIYDKEIGENNKKLLKAIMIILKDNYKNKKINDTYLLTILQGQTNLALGLRALTGITAFEFKDGKQDVSTWKGEHIKSSSEVSAELFDWIRNNKSKITDLDNIIKKFNQVFGDKKLFDIVDKKLGKTSTLGLERITKALGAKKFKNIYVPEIESNIFDLTLQNKIKDLEKNKKEASKFNNKKLPLNEKLKGNFTNEQVLDKMSELDKKQSDAQMAFSKSQNLNEDFNKILENKTGIGADKVYSDVKAQVVGANKGKFNFFVPPSAEDFVGLLYKTLGKGKLGDAQMAWYKKNLLDPFARAMDNISRDRIALMNDFKALKKELKIVPKNLKKKLPGEPFTQEQAIRTYIWNKQGMSPEGMSKADLKELTDFVESKPELVLFADQLIALQKGDQYPAPKFGWLAGNITTDLMDGINTIKRAKYLEQWQYNVDEIFTKPNLNKLEAAYGKDYRTALENILKRMRTGRNREFTSDSLTGRVTDWLTNSIGAIMFFNTRSAVLQTISAVNFINFKDNNIFAAGKAFANQPQFWKDFITLFNSDFLVDRRNGLKLNVNEADIADMAKKGGVRGVISEMLRIGFLPTQIADSFAIASGGSTFYRNRVKKYTKEGMSKTEAENQAFIDFRETAEEAQQSSRPDRISQQQAGPLGRVILAFANTPMQYTRLIKKAASDLKNRRGDTLTNISKIFYYGVAQNLFFNAMQQALFAMGFGDEEEEKEKREEKYANIVNSMADSILRGAGVGGAIFSVLKNTAIKLSKEAQKKSPKFQDVLTKEIAQLSPPVSSKLSKLRAAGRAYSWNKKEIMEKGFSLDNPAYLAAGQVIAATTNIPLDRAFKKIDNIRKASSSDYEAWARIAMLAGWSDWELGVKKEKPKSKKKKKTKRNTKIIK